MLTNDSLILLESKEPPLDVLTNLKNPLDLTEDDNAQTRLNAADDLGIDTDMSVVGSNGDALASANNVGAEMESHLMQQVELYLIWNLYQVICKSTLDKFLIKTLV